MTPNKDRLIDLTPWTDNDIPGVSEDEARAAVRSGDVERIGALPGHFAIAEREERTVRLARTLGVPLRYFVAKRMDGPFLIVARTIEEIWQWCVDRGIAWQFDPSYTRLVPAHHLVEIEQVGCPDPNPVYTRFFDPAFEQGPADIAEAGRRYIGAVHDGLRGHLARLPADEPVGLAFSGGIDSTSVLLLARHALAGLGHDPDRVRPFTLEVAGGGDDAAQAAEVLETLGLAHTGETIRADADALDIDEAIAVTEDYRPLDLQCATALLALLRGVRERHPDLVHMLDGDGSDENLRSYPIEDSELTIHSVRKNPLLYVEGWGVDAIKHSLVFSGGLSRSIVRTWAPHRRFGFRGFSPYTMRPAIAEAVAVPLPELVGESLETLYGLKGRVVAAGVEAITGVRMPTPPKRRFQDGVTGAEEAAARLDCTKEACRARWRGEWDRRLAEATAPRRRSTRPAPSPGAAT